VVLVTGGTGFLGAVLIDQLLNQKETVRATHRVGSHIPEILQNRTGLEWIVADMLDYFALEKAFDQITEVYHCAAQVSYHPAHRHSMWNTNVEGTAHVVNLSLKHAARLVHVSSIASLGEGKPGRDTDEEDLWEQGSSPSAYALAKYHSEMEVWRGFSEGLNGVIVNPSLIIGASAGHRGSGAVFHLLHKGLRFYPGGSVGLVDVEDVAYAMIQLMSRSDISEERFIVSNVNMTHKDLLGQCSQYLGRPAPGMQARAWMLALAWRASAMVAWLSGKKSALTKESARASTKKLRFSNQKLVDCIGMEFKPIEQTLKEICTEVLNQNA